jgi:hypothetical protein
VICLFLFGGWSQLETFDMKPDVPAEVRGPYRPIASSVPGFRVCEHLPLLARRMDRVAVVRSVRSVRSVHSDDANHNPSLILTGHHATIGGTALGEGGAATIAGSGWACRVRNQDVGVQQNAHSPRPSYMASLLSSTTKPSGLRSARAATSFIQASKCLSQSPADEALGDDMAACWRSAATMVRSASMALSGKPVQSMTFAGASGG